MRNRFHVVAAAAVFFAATAAVPASGGTEMTRAEKAERALSEVWREVSSHHFREDFDARYRESVYGKFRPRVLASPDDAALVERLNEMLSAVGESHLRVFGPARDGRLKKVRPVEKPGKIVLPVDPGITLLDDGERLLVRDVRKDSAAARAGVRPGDEVLNVEGLDFPAGRDDGVPTRGMLARGLLARGGAGSVCAVKLRGPDGKTRELELVRSVNGGKYFMAANLPRQALHYEVRRLDENTGYLRFDLFVPDVARSFRADFRKGELKGISQLIVDLRGNPGGLMLAAEWLGSWCLAGKTPFGELEKSGVRLTPVSEPQANGFRGRLIVLVDGETMSTGELFAAAVQDAKAGRIVGTKTPGKCLPSFFLNLSCGLRLQTVAGNVRRPSGAPLEGVGVTPDTTVRNAFRDGRDLVIDRALAILNGKEEK